MLTYEHNIFTVQPTPVLNTKPSLRDKIKDGALFRVWNYIKMRLFGEMGSIVPSTRLSISDNEVDSKFTDGFYGLITISILTAASFSISLLPVHNVLTNQTYWYEIILSTINWAFFMACVVVMEIEVILDARIMKSKTRFAADIFMTLKITEILGICFSI